MQSQAGKVTVACTACTDKLAWWQSHRIGFRVEQHLLVLLVSKADHCTTHLSQSVYQTLAWRVRIPSLLLATDCRDSTAASIVGHAHHLFRKPCPARCSSFGLLY